MSQQLISLLKDIGRVKIDLNALATSEDGDAETKRLELQAQLDQLMMEHAQLMKGGERDAPPQAPETGEGPPAATFEEKERHFRAKAPATNGHRGELARLLERQRRKASEEGLNFTAGGAVSTADAFSESHQKEELAQEAPEGQKPASAAQDLPGAVDGAVRETRSDCADEAQVTYPPSPPSPASPAPWDEDTMIIHHVLPGVAGTSGPAAASLDSVAEPVQELDEEPGEAVPQTRGMGGRSMSGSSVRFQQEPDVVHFDTDSPAREDRLAIAAPEAVADPPVTAVTAPAAEAEAQVPEASVEPAAKAEAQEPEATVEPSAEAEAQDPEAVIEPEPAKLLVPEPDITDTPQPLADAAREKVAGNLPTSVAEATTDTPPKMEVEVVETQPDSVEGAPGPIEAPKEAEDAQAVAKPSLAAAAGLATAKTPSKAEGVKPTSGKVPKAGMTAQTVSAAAKRRPAPKAASVPKAAPHTKKEVAAKPTPPAPKAAPPVAKATPSTGKAAAAKPKAAQRRARSHDERQQRQPGSRRHSAEVSKAMSDALSAAAQEKPKPAWGGSGKLVTRPAAEVRRASPRPKAMNSKPTKAASFADLRPAPEKLGSAQPPAQEKAPSQVVSQAKASSKRRVSEGEAALEKMAKDLEKNVKAAQALCLRESEKCAVRHMKAAEAEAAAVRQAMALQAAVSAPPQSPIKDTKESESPAIPAEPVSQRSGSLRLALADLVQQEDTDDAQLAMAVQRVLGDSLPSSPSHSSSRHSGLLTQSSPQLLVSHEVPLRIGSRPRSASGSPRHSHKELPTQDEGAKKKVVKSSPAHRPGRGEDSPPRAGSPPHRSQQCQPATASKMTPRKKVDIRPAWDDRFYVVEAKKHQLRKSELDEDVPHEDEVQQETPQRRVRSRSPTTEAAKAPQGAAAEKRPAPKAKGKSKAHEKARIAPTSPEAQAQAAVSPRSQVPAERFAADRAVRQAGGSSPRR